jgi:hypothetical protein
MGVSGDDTGLRGRNDEGSQIGEPKIGEIHEKNNQARRAVVGCRRNWWSTCLCAGRQRRSRPRAAFALAWNAVREWT